MTQKAGPASVGAESVGLRSSGPVEPMPSRRLLERAIMMLASMSPMRCTYSFFESDRSRYSYSGSDQNPLSNVPSQCQGPAHYLAHHQPSARRVAVRAGRYPAPWRSCASAKAPASTGKAAGGPTSTMNLKRRRTSTGTVAVLLWSRDERSALGRETRRSAG